MIKLLDKIIYSSSDLEIFFSYEFFDANKEKIDFSKIEEIIVYLFAQKTKISANIMTFNEEDTIEKCIYSILDVVDEIVIIDTGSTDKTLEKIPKNKKIRVFEEKWNENFSEIRNKLINLSENDWIFVIDSDEILIDPELIDFIKIFNNFPKKKFVIGNELINTDSSNCYVKRIFNKRDGIFFKGKVHEFLSIKNLEVESYIILNLKMNHYGYEKEKVLKKNKIERNLKLIEEMMILEPKELRWMYFFSREKIQKVRLNWDLNEVLKLEKDIEIYLAENKFVYDKFNFKLGIMLNLCELYLYSKNFQKLIELLDIIKIEFPQNLDIYFYYIMYEKLNFNIEIKNSINKFLTEICDENKVSIIDSENIHIVKSIFYLFLMNLDFKKCESLVDKLVNVNELQKLFDEVISLAEKIKEIRNV
ncbi:TPA: glycosyltransferase family 2 protein [Clostridium perfringens]|nr:glycosyltransferase family 2 protein [Clostridium perfringens]HBI7036566.1 glycosyltransferase family 2 protein [Clostridium perfringens]HBI7050694.1 glycosyltransferase family 2 protein [Clostridium perfringens]